MTLDEIQALLRTRQEAKTLSRDDIPISQGLYVWSSARSGDVLYVGKASGQRGLRGRIWSQHLNPLYLESRETKFRVPADDFQRSCNVLKNGKVCVDKSVFRRSIGARFSLGPGEGTVRYIREHLSLAWMTLAPDQVCEISRLERELIRELKPSLNVASRNASGSSAGVAPGVSGETLNTLEREFHAIIRARAAEFSVEIGVELPSLAQLVAQTEPKAWFPIPGMYGGFSYWLTGSGNNIKLIAESWCRVTDGSGQRHEITPEGSKLVAVGFV